MHFSLLPLSLLLALTTAHPLEPRAATTCGSTSYTAAQVNSAAQKACTYYKAGTSTNSYPHTYNNLEGFSFTVAGPYQEFPMLASHAVYTGGSPGPDRVIINTACKLAGAITHTGASGNNFVGCAGTN
ncbi:Microbial ribonuclease [Glarea lozoyensis ATCC 20868]|uniref:ribonuclease T1 n=1 Tax=Glarea lozoyensis (strain ATCC 20868 / MF5171) TaxID=1116229 RepID=S3D868_GLAL2|nr:Microbial ribonuclease [Glarea lozoyensis ATCC 20868]EPE33955.1 Microbial ribonuclease [Glarea lozoyensis ATCC 20868]